MVKEYSSSTKKRRVLRFADTIENASYFFGEDSSLYDVSGAAVSCFSCGGKCYGCKGGSSKSFERITKSGLEPKTV